mmetsp:Transcript_7817/g.19297  ORF Transcript_7817/g.19297 Transcript_7817/m.19297 type:complete len:246 (-) Transcript_7817:566-1303(-)
MGLKSRIFCRTSVDPAVQRFYVHKNERLGKGNFALSFRATDRVDNSAVACKCFKLGKSKVIGSEILNEVQFLQELEHPNIVRMLAHGVSGREYVIVLEMLSKNLLQIVTESHGLPMPQALQYSRDILCGLAHCHSRGILHRDVKLENIMVDDKTGLVKLIDFGLSCTLGALSTDANPFVGTTSYLAPEVRACTALFEALRAQSLSQPEIGLGPETVFIWVRHMESWGGVLHHDLQRVPVQNGSFS